jgi:hypothetical protein
MSALVSVGESTGRDGPTERGEKRDRKRQIALTSSCDLLGRAAAESWRRRREAMGSEGFVSGGRGDDVGKRSRVRRRGHWINATEWQAKMGRMRRGPAVF